jgi:ribulose-bisphosphate carboxylase large chain
MTLPQNITVPNLSGERFRVRYHLTGTEDEARANADHLRNEQTVEFPTNLLPEGDLSERIMGQVEDFAPVADGVFSVTISYAVETAGAELPQLMNVVFSNGSFMSGVRVERLELPDSLLSGFRGPRFGIEGLRERLRVPDRPLLCTPIKPMGLSPERLADMAYRLALGGMDLIKDDHGITNLPFCPFEERVERCAEAVARANRETGFQCLYAANVTAPAHLMLERAIFARHAGAGALLISPAITGFDAARQLADDDRLDLPIVAHPAGSGNFVSGSEARYSLYVYYGQLHRLAGADAVVYMNYGGRFPISEQDCLDAKGGCRDAMGHFKTIFPAPGGGMTLGRIPELREFYGDEVVFVIGGDLHQHSADLTTNVREFLKLME